MAGTLLHITLAEQALTSARIDAAARDEINRHLQDFRLGAVFPDLPYHDRILLSGLRLLLAHELCYNAWGTLLHARSPVGLTLAFLDTAGDPAGKARALGCLTHFSVDVVFHAEISSRVMAEADGSTSLDMEHRRIEEQMDLHVHRHLLGHSGMGTAYAGRMLRLRPAGSWTEHAREAVASVHENAPAVASFEKWRNELALYGVLSSTRAAPWVTTAPARDESLEKSSLEMAEESIRLAAEHIEIGIRYLEGKIGRDDFFELIPDRSMMDGGPASPPRKK